MSTDERGQEAAERERRLRSWVGRVDRVGAQPYSPADLMVWAVAEIDRLRASTAAVDPLDFCSICGRHNPTDGPDACADGHDLNGMRGGGRAHDPFVPGLLRTFADEAEHHGARVAPSLRQYADQYAASLSQGEGEGQDLTPTPAFRAAFRAGHDWCATPTTRPDWETAAAQAWEQHVVRPAATQPHRTTSGDPMDDVTVLRKLIAEHTRELYRTDGEFSAEIDDYDAEKLARAILADHRFAALRNGS